MNALDHRFSVAPMMDGADRARKAKCDQHLNGAVSILLYQMQHGAVDEHLPANEFQ